MFRLARESAEKAKPSGRLEAYLDILKYYTIDNHPELAEKLAKLE
jgi:hypothetical protein